MNIVLIGMRGSGKSTVGKMLAKKIKKEFVNMDGLLEQKEKKRLPTMISLYGWEYFREKESEIAEEISHKTNTVISTGGGIILRKENIDALKRNGKFIFLKTSVDTMLKRIKNATNRPALTHKQTLKDEIQQVWKERKELYEQAADITIETDRKTVEEIANEIIEQL
jgi:shikimate kinase